MKLELEKLATEKTEMQRHYVMVRFDSIMKILTIINHMLLYSYMIFLLSFSQYYEMSYGLNVEMHKQVMIKNNFWFILFLFFSSSCLSSKVYHFEVCCSRYYFYLSIFINHCSIIMIGFHNQAQQSLLLLYNVFSFIYIFFFFSFN